jgi:hypothetical protein
MITLRVNGQTQSFDGDPSMPVLWYLRDVLGLTARNSAAAWRPAAPARFISTATPRGHAKHR